MHRPDIHFLSIQICEIALDVYFVEDVDDVIVEWGDEQLGENVHWLDDRSVVPVVVDTISAHLSLQRHNVYMVLQRINDARFEYHSDYLTLDPIAVNHHRIDGIDCIQNTFKILP